MIVLKVGGPLVAIPKGGKLHVRTDVLTRIAREVSEAFNELLERGERLIIVRGGTFSRVSSVQSEKDLVSLGEGVSLHTILDALFAKILTDAGVPAIPLHSFSLVELWNDALSSLFPRSFERALDMGMVPVLGSMCAHDRNRGVGFVSADDLCEYIARRYDVRAFVIATDVDGVFDADPRKKKDARLLEHVENPEMLVRLEGELPKTVLRLAGTGVRVYVVNGLRSSRIRSALLGKVKGSVVEPLRL